jgi:phosphoglycolate phosphatase-like HAD superfamily hydrolase
MSSISFRLYLIGLLFSASAYAGKDPLPSWNEGEVKKALLQYVEEVNDKEGPHYIPPEERIATFDQDGTLWVEQPLYTQLFFAFDRIKALAEKHPEWKEQEPFKAILAEDQQATSHFTEQDVAKIVVVTHSGMSVATFEEIVLQWLNQAVHPRFKKPFTALAYLPMLELLQLLKDNGFTNYIVSGGGQEFIRAYANGLYQIPPERVIGSAGKVKYEVQNGQPELFKLPELLFIDDHGGKPEGINLIIGRRPVAAFGNSDGDRQMLEWTQGGKGKRLELLVHHDDEKREYAYGPKTKIGTFSSSLMEEAQKRGWLVVSMKNDWKVIFPSDDH